jgi:hypothetical protein
MLVWDYDNFTESSKSKQIIKINVKLKDRIGREKKDSIEKQNWNIKYFLKGK